MAGTYFNQEAPRRKISFCSSSAFLSRTIWPDKPAVL
jgi:hypothetical protein